MFTFLGVLIYISLLRLEEADCDREQANSPSNEILDSYPTFKYPVVKGKISREYIQTHFDLREIFVLNQGNQD